MEKPACFTFIAFTSMFLFTILSCTHKEIIGDLETPPAYKVSYDFSNPEILQKTLKDISNLKIAENRRKLVQILIAYNSLSKAQKKNQIVLLPYSKTSLTVNSFCAAPQKAAPEKMEVFKWVKGSPKISLLKEIISLYSKKQNLESQKIQEIIWNLANDTNYEDYPESSKKILQEASPNAFLSLPSKIKSQAFNEIAPDELKRAAIIIKGKHHSFEEFKDAIDKKKSNIPISGYDLSSQLPESKIYATTISNGYHSQAVTFYNPSRENQNFNISDYYLKPVREDVQPIVLASVFPYSDEIQKILERYALSLLGYIGSQYPSLNEHEKILVKQSPIESAIVFYNASIAENKSEEFFPSQKSNGSSDAFRHYTWAGLLTRDIGEDAARTFLNAHELNQDQPIYEKEMDEFNNERGIQAAKDLLEKGSFENDELYEKGKDELKNGTLRTMDNERL